MAKDCFSAITPDNAEFLQALYVLYQKDDNSIDKQWRDLFDALQALPSKQVPSFACNVPANQPDNRLERLIEAYRSFGHLKAATNPLYPRPEKIAQLELERFGFDNVDLEKSFLDPNDGSLRPLKDIIADYARIYCGSIGFEFMHVVQAELESWLQKYLEQAKADIAFTAQQKKDILLNLTRAELLEEFLHTKFVGQKRFSLEGGETLIPMLKELLDRAAALQVQDFVLGMAHRGRLNVLAHILNKSYAQIFFEFHDNYIPESFEHSWDVKYHKGFFSETTSSHGHKINITLTPNPSHLEAVDPVVEGQAYAKQMLWRTAGKDDEKALVLPILIHGDAALAGQGVVYETLQLSGVCGYSTGGTIHIIVNNQIGFTTIPKEYSCMRYCTDVAKTFGFPVLHVNADDPEAAVFAIELAINIRQTFKCDVLIDLVCYRKYGHNESDEPAFTQPLKYQMIAQKKSIRQQYRQRLIAQNIISQQEADQEEEALKAIWQQELKQLDPHKRPFSRLASHTEHHFHHLQTGVPMAVLEEIGERSTHIPEDFSAHPKLMRLLKERRSMVIGDPLKPMDWAMAELLALGSLLLEKRTVRLSGQDSSRGTFSQRHALWVDQKNSQIYVPLNHLKTHQSQLQILNSPLSEYAVLGFEFGYSTADIDALVLWEAQFGDFSNAAQVIIDQFIATGEQKWGQQSSLVLLLPHGYEGQGPEHSSARMERFLILSGQNNLQVTNPSTPAQYFHLLRRQARLKDKKPLIIFTPKSLLRHPSCTSSLEELTLGSFQEILDDGRSPLQADKIVACTGHIYYDLIAERDRLQIENMAIIRFEQLYPLHTDRIKELLAKYSTAKEFYWVQEEPTNMGASQYVAAALMPILAEMHIAFHVIGRPRSASPAVGSYLIHKKQLEQILQELFGKRAPSIFEIAGKGKRNAT